MPWWTEGDHLMLDAVMIAMLVGIPLWRWWARRVREERASPENWRAFKQACATVVVGAAALAAIMHWF